MSESIDINKFNDCFVNALGINKNDVSMDKRLLEDFGADSLDLLDLIYQLERAFNIEISRGEIEQRSRARLNSKEFEVDGIITKEGIKSLALEFPEVDFSVYEKRGLTVKDIPQFFTVRTFYNIVQYQLQRENIMLNKA